jgi:hypothetical protein
MELYTIIMEYKKYRQTADGYNIHTNALIGLELAKYVLIRLVDNQSVWVRI